MDSPLPEHRHYGTVEKLLRNSVSEGQDFLFDSVKFHEELLNLETKYGFPYDSLVSFLRNLHLHHVKKAAPRVKSTLKGILQRYCEGQSIVDLAWQVNYPPYLLSRFLVEEISRHGGNKKSLTATMKHPASFLKTKEDLKQQYEFSEEVGSNMEDCTRLAAEVLRAIDCDPMYGPSHDRQRHLIGVEYEVLLEYQLKELNIPFETEKELRHRGTSRTPDILLSYPLSVEVFTKHGTEWKVVYWIDSKALFGDVDTHRVSVLAQAESYIHRFGPGLVLYWFGHAPLDALDDAQGDISIIGWELPTRFMLPTGEILTRGKTND
ncbi:hypothetical protein FisN_6Lh224 [Fistulifera solaris]|uniref:CDAN1-interacting nuclease 1 n=1 Tax=Fistulifera solaris TaxID=1519565 RepID=A0A1Z5J5Y9_FISSO|nr:hypothetical protein FisN_6Lh224 [Fistulifera solaris]|eukprot:GAX09403.1 hypothetical protein FisN_6Lh224 [Fistulifera solaris]